MFPSQRISVSIFTESFYDRLQLLAADIVENNETKLFPYAYTERLGLSFYTCANELPEFQELMDDCLVPLPHRPLIGFSKPNDSIRKHIDNHNTGTKILVPILPINTSNKLNFYDDYNSDSVFSIPTIYREPIVFDTDKIHGVTSIGPEWRATFQLSLSAPYTQVCELIKTNSLFKNIQTSMI